MIELQEGFKDQFAKIAVKKGFELLRSSGKHNVWKHPSGAQITSPKTTSDWRAVKNFTSEIKYRLNQAGVKEPKPIEKVIQKVREPKPERISSAQRRFDASNKSTGTQTSFKEFMNKVNAAKNAPNEIQKRMEKGIVDTMKSWDFATKQKEAEKILRQLRRG